MDRKIKELEGKNFDKISGNKSNVGKRWEFIILADANPKNIGEIMDRKVGTLTKLGEATVKELDLLTGTTRRRLFDGEWVEDSVSIETFSSDDVIDTRLRLEKPLLPPLWRRHMGLDK